MEKAKSRGPGRTSTTFPDELMGKKEISLQARVILAKILNLWTNCKKVYISNSKLSQFIGLDERSVRRAKSELVKLNLISVHQETKGRGNLATIQVDEKEVNKFLGFQYFPEKREAVKNDIPQQKNEGFGKYPWGKVIS